MKITFIHHSSFCIELEKINMIFDYTEGNLPEGLHRKPLFVFVSHSHWDHYSKEIFQWADSGMEVFYIISSDIQANTVPLECQKSVFWIKPEETLEFQEYDLWVHGYESNDEGVAFLIRQDGICYYHGGDLNNWFWNGEPQEQNLELQSRFRREIQKMAGMNINIAFLPLDSRMEDKFYLGMDEFLSLICTDVVFPMHCWGDFSVIKKIKAMDCSAGYREKIVEIEKDGQIFLVNLQDTDRKVCLEMGRE